MLVVIANNFNGVYALTFIPILKFACSFIGMLSFYAIRKELPIHGMNYIFLILGLITFEARFMLANLVSDPWLNSTTFLNIIKLDSANYSKTHGRKYLRRYLKSFNLIRVIVGGIYYYGKEC